MTMLETSFGRSAGGAGAVRRRRRSPGKSPSRSRAMQDLADDLLGGQVAHQLLRAGVAEGAGQRAADLAGDAERAAAFLGDVDGLDLDRPAGAARRKAEQPFARAVRRRSARSTISGRASGEMLGELGAQLLRDVGHAGEIGDAAEIDPVPELAGAHPGLALRHDARSDERLAELGARQADQRRLLGLCGAGAQCVTGALGGEIE